MPKMAPVWFPKKAVTPRKSSAQAILQPALSRQLSHTPDNGLKMTTIQKEEALRMMIMLDSWMRTRLTGSECKNDPFKASLA